MSDFVIDAWRHGIEVVDEVRKVVNGYLCVLQPWQLVVVSVCGTVVYMRVRRLIRKSDRPIMKRYVNRCSNHYLIDNSKFRDMEMSVVCF